MANQPNPPRLHGLGDILELLWPHIIADNVHLAPDLPIGIVGHANSARFGNAFKASGNVDAISKDVVVIDNDIPDMNADAKFDPLILWDRSTPLGHSALDFNSATNRIHDARELDQQAVAGGLNDPTSMLGNSEVHQFLPDCFEPGQGAFLVGGHKAAIPRDIRRQHCRQSPLCPVARQNAPRCL